MIMSIGANIKKIRSKTKYSQQDLADMLNIDRHTYINWENETTDVKAHYIPKLAEIFKVGMADFFENPSNIVSINNDNSVGNQNGIIINLTDRETAEKFGKQIEELISKLNLV